MDPVNMFPDSPIHQGSTMADSFTALGIRTFHDACEYVHNLPYGYNSNRDDLMILFKERQGTCITKHAVIASLASEMDLPVYKHIGIYAMTETLVSGTNAILEKYSIPWIPMTHCFLSDDIHRVDLTEGNQNGKNGPINEFLSTIKVEPDISEKNEYLFYRNALKEQILKQGPLEGIPMKIILQGREEGLAILKRNIL